MSPADRAWQALEAHSNACEDCLWRVEVVDFPKPYPVCPTGERLYRLAVMAEEQGAA